MLALLDTTVLIDCLRGRPAVQRVDELWDLGDTPATSVVNIEEVVRGLRPPERPQARTFIASLEILTPDAETAWQSWDWRREFAGRGITLHQSDCLVGATAFRYAARLCTGNPKDFPMTELTLEHWPVGA